jgi:hypothetical protein
MILYALSYFVYTLPFAGIYEAGLCAVVFHDKTNERRTLPDILPLPAPRQPRKG